MFSVCEGPRGCHFGFFLIHALHLVGFDVEVFLPLERLPATANESVLPGHSTYDVSVIYLLILTKQYHMNGIFEILIDICILYQ